MVRLKEIAEAAGVSMMTVSKALRDKPDVSAATRERIRSLAQQMGYVPNSSAQHLRSGSSRLLGVVISAATNPINPRLLMSLEDQAQELGFELLIGQTMNRAEREEAVLKRFIRRQVDGIFITPVYRLDQRAPIYEELQRRGIPVVILGSRGLFCERFPSVETDELMASAEVTRHLVQLGHRRIAFLAGPLVSPSAQERLEGYRRTLREAGIPIDDALIFSAGSTIEEGSAAAVQFLSEKTDATAIQCSHDLVAIGAADMLLNQGFRIPQDFSVTGFGNVLAAEYFRVPLTTIRQPKARLGVVAMDAMTRLLRGETVTPQRLPAPLEVRASSGPPRAHSLV